MLQEKHVQDVALAQQELDAHTLGKQDNSTQTFKKRVNLN